jgi:urea transporter
MSATFFNIEIGISGLLGVCISNVFALLIGVNEDRIKKGLYGFNGLLLTLAIAMNYRLDVNLLLILVPTIVLLVFLNMAMEHILGFFLGLPVLSFPFVMAASIASLAFYNYHGLTIQTVSPFLYDKYFPEVHEIFLFYLKSMSAIFFQSSPWAGLIIMSALLIFSRIAFFLSVIGFFTGYLFHVSLLGNMSDISTASAGFNYILTCIAVGGIFLIPNIHTFLLAIMATLVSAIMASFMKIYMVSFSLPVLTMPFVTVTLLFMYCIRLLYNKKFRLVDFLPGSPESNLDYFKSHLERFGETGFEIRLPFLGKWMVSQGYNGEYTHKGLWDSSLDFMAVGEDNKSFRRNEKNNPEDFYSYGLPVFSVAGGTVIKVVNHLDDNLINEINVKENWGNLILIQHGIYLYSVLCHLQKNSILLKEGEFVSVGTKLGLTGNSGRSPQPHIHLHFQGNPEIGSRTVAITFAQYLRHNEKTGVLFNSIPSEKEVLSNINADYNSRTFFNLAPGVIIKCRVVKNESNAIEETWQARVDFIGSRYLENDKGDKVFFYLAGDYFACLDYQGGQNSALFIFFLTYFRLPFININAVFKEKISYKYFSSWLVRTMKDIVQPFTNRFSYNWISEFSSAQERRLQINIYNLNQRVCHISADLTAVLPGTIGAEFENGDKWTITQK